MKKVIIIHGWDGKPEHGWYLWLANELEKKSFISQVPEMPNTEKPEIKAWISKIEKVAGKADKETLFVGHSIGCQAILRYLEKLPKEIKVKKCILVAPWMKLDKQTIKEEGPEVEEIARPWMETPIDYKKVKSHCKKFVCIFSNNDPYTSLSNTSLFKKILNAKIIVLKNRGHFTEDDGIKQLPEILQFIK